LPNTFLFLYYFHSANNFHSLSPILNVHINRILYNINQLKSKFNWSLPNWSAARQTTWNRGHRIYWEHIASSESRAEPLIKGKARRSPLKLKAFQHLDIKRTGQICFLLRRTKYHNIVTFIQTQDISFGTTLRLQCKSSDDDWPHHSSVKTAADNELPYCQAYAEVCLFLFCPQNC